MLLSTLLTAAFGLAAGQPVERPNVVLIFADDLGYGDVASFAENCPFQTPHLDRMAAEGACLTSFYVPTPSAAICNTTEFRRRSGI